MSIRVMSKVWEHSQHSGSALLLLLAISDFANDDGFAWPSIGSLAKKIRRTERPTQRLLGTLTESGELTIDYKKGPYQANLYRVAVVASTPGGVVASTPGGVVASTPGGVVASTPGGGGVLIPKVVASTPPNPSVPVIEPSVGVPDASVLESKEPKFVEIPSKAEFIAASENRGVPEWWAANDYAYRSEQPEKRWPSAHWQTAVTTCFERWRAAGAPMEPCGVKKNGQPKVWEIQRTLDALRDQVRNHPANESSSSYLGEVSDMLSAEFRALQHKLRDTERQLAGLKT